MKQDNFVKRRKFAQSLKRGTGGMNPCFRPSRGAAKADLAEFHREDLKLRRAGQRKRLPGFMAVPNKRIDAAVDSATAVIMLANAEQVASGISTPLDPLAARHEALRQVAHGLPAPAMVFDWSNKGRTKNDEAEYRRAGTLLR